MGPPPYLALSKMRGGIQDQAALPPYLVASQMKLVVWIKRLSPLIEAIIPISGSIKNERGIPDHGVTPLPPICSILNEGDNPGTSGRSWYAPASPRQCLNATRTSIRWLSALFGSVQKGAQTPI